MASLSTDKRGNRTIQFASGDKRYSVRLGKMPVKQVAAIKTQVESIIAAKLAGFALGGETAAWLAALGDEMHAKLSAVGLVADRQRQALGDFLAAWLAKRAGKKPNSLKNYAQAIGKLNAFFGEKIGLQEITETRAEEFMADLIANHAKATAGRLLKFAKQFFAEAVRTKYIAENPFAHIAAPPQINEARKFFVTRDVTQRIIDACPDAEWRLIVALARYGGLRVPSELAGLRWSDVDWTAGRLLVRSPKTEHHEGGDTRLTPLFPELRPYLEEQRKVAEPDAEYVIATHRRGDNNLRTHLARIAKKAGVSMWQKPFVNLRASRETELAAQYPMHVVCAWIGNSERVARKHYLQVVDADFDRAADSGASAVQIPVRSEAGTNGLAESMSTQDDTDDHFRPILSFTDHLGDNEYYTRQESNGFTQVVAPVKCLRKIEKSCAACSGAFFDDPDFLAVSEAWPTLPSELKSAVLAIVRAADERRAA